MPHDTEVEKEQQQKRGNLRFAHGCYPIADTECKANTDNNQRPKDSRAEPCLHQRRFFLPSEYSLDEHGQDKKNKPNQNRQCQTKLNR